jgi:hypothetical protein
LSGRGGRSSRRVQSGQRAPTEARRVRLVSRQCASATASLPAMPRLRRAGRAHRGGRQPGPFHPSNHTLGNSCDSGGYRNGNALAGTSARRCCTPSRLLHLIPHASRQMRPAAGDKVGGRSAIRRHRPAGLLQRQCKGRGGLGFPFGTTSRGRLGDDFKRAGRGVGTGIPTSWRHRRRCAIGWMAWTRGVALPRSTRERPVVSGCFVVYLGGCWSLTRES